MSENDSEKKGLLWYVFPIAVLLLFAGGYLVFSNPSKTGEAVAINGPAMFFYSENCYYCKQQMPIVKQLISEGYEITYMDVGANPGYLVNYSVQGTPTFIASNGDRKVGLTQYDELKAWLDQHGAK